MSLVIEILLSLGLAATLVYVANQLQVEWRTKRILTVAIVLLLVIWLAYIILGATGVIRQ